MSDKAVAPFTQGTTGRHTYVEEDTGRALVQTYPDDILMDAFSRPRISEPFTIFDSKFLHDKQPLFWDELFTGSGIATFQANNASILMSVSTGGDTIIRQTFQRFRYQPGKGQMVLLTGTLKPETGVIKRLGLFEGSSPDYGEPKNGIYFEASSGTIFACISKNGAHHRAPRSEWSDPMDGTGKSKVLLDFSNPQIFQIDFQWLGYGRTRFCFYDNGVLLHAHALDHANFPAAGAYIRSPNLPLRYSMESFGGSGSMLQTCQAVMSEGGQQITGITRSIDTGASPLLDLLPGSGYPLLALRLNPSKPYAEVKVERVAGLALTGANVQWLVLRNPTISGFNSASASWADVASDSAIQKFVFATKRFLFDEGTKLFSGYFSNDTDSVLLAIDPRIKFGIGISGLPDFFVLANRTVLGGANNDVVGGLTVSEID